MYKDKEQEECHLGGEGAGGVGLDAAHHAQVVQTQEPAPSEREVHPSSTAQRRSYNCALVSYSDPYWHHCTYCTVHTDTLTQCCYQESWEQSL